MRFAARWDNAKSTRKPKARSHARNEQAPSPIDLRLRSGSGCHGGGVSSPRVTDQTRQGYLVPTDVSGYAAFLAGSELEHADAIVQELTALIRERLSPAMRFVQLEGDAVFCFLDQKSFADRRRLLELIESCYFDFSNRLPDMIHGTTCRCATCTSIGSLDLKFVAGSGAYRGQPDGDRSIRPDQT